MESQKDINPWLKRWQDAFSWLRGFIYGMTYYEMELRLRRLRSDLEHLFDLISFGDLIGVPILPPYYSLRLLPFIVPCMEIGVAGCSEKKI